MIVRILSAGQYRLPSSQFDRLNELDNKVVDAVAAGDQKQFGQLFAKMVKLVKEKGEPLPAEVIAESQVILPDPDITIEEAKSLFVGEGLIPG